MSGQPSGQQPECVRRLLRDGWLIGIRRGETAAFQSSPSPGWEQSAQVEEGFPPPLEQQPRPPYLHDIQQQPHAPHGERYFQHRHAQSTTPPPPNADAHYPPNQGLEEPVYYEHYDPHQEHLPHLQNGHELPQWVSHDQHRYYNHPPPVHGQGQYVQMNAPPPPAAAPPPPPPAHAPSPGDQMQMLMMNQMMMQQMAAQQMQVAQMAALGRGAGASGGSGGCGEGSCQRRKGATMINVKGRSERPRRRPKVVRAASPPPAANAPPVKPIIAVVPPRANLPATVADSSALDNWQEATIILCVAIVGLIYLVSSRGAGASGDKEKKPSLAEKHLT